jgi:glycosyltransferase involved in cell wall biosynthesis
VAAAVASVRRQSFTDLEIVVVDDGSATDAADAVHHLAQLDERVRTIRLERSVGASEARNRGLATAAGEFVAFLDDDDEWVPDAAKIAVATLRRRPELVGVSAWHRVVPEGQRPVVYRGPLEYEAKDLLWCNFPAVPFAVLRRDVLGDELHFDGDLITCEDWDLFLRCARRGPLATVPEVLYRYHQRRTARVTDSAARKLDGKRRFVRKHESEMTPLCRDYHDAKEQIMAATGWGEKMWLAPRLLRAIAPRASGVVVRESLSARVGWLTRDPGRSARTLLSLVRRLD